MNQEKRPEPAEQQLDLEAAAQAAAKKEGFTAMPLGPLARAAITAGFGTLAELHEDQGVVTLRPRLPDLAPSQPAKAPPQPYLVKPGLDSATVRAAVEAHFSSTTTEPQEGESS